MSRHCSRSTATKMSWLSLVLVLLTAAPSAEAFAVSTLRKRPWSSGSSSFQGSSNDHTKSWRKRLFRKSLSFSLSSDEDEERIVGFSTRRSSTLPGWRSSSLSSSSSSSKRARIWQWSRRTTSMVLRGKKDDTNDNDDDNKVSPIHNDNDNNKNNKVEATNVVVQKWQALLEAWTRAWESVMKDLPSFPEPMREAWNNAWEGLARLRWVFLSFATGCVFATAAILVPIYNQVETLSKPVTLFETILSDLEQGYVDPVDTNKLFETGVSAMLRSLDPYTEYEGPQEAVELNESIDGKYGGVGLVITGNTKPIPVAKQEEAKSSSSDDTTIPAADGKPITSAPKEKSSSGSLVAMEDEDDEDELDEEDVLAQQQESRYQAKAQQQGIRVVNAFENYAFDYGMRVGDKLVAVDDFQISPETTVEGVRNRLRGEPGTLVSISFERDGVTGVQTITMPRSVVRVRDVKLATLLGNPKDGIGYIQLSGFASETGREMRNAIHYLQRAAEDASDGTQSLQGLVLDLRGNPGGLLTSAVDVASLLVPKGSDIVSAKGRGFPGVLYRSRVEPILDSNTKLAVLVNRGTASAAEIVSGAVQDLDVGVVVGSDRTFGKGLVQNVEGLPYDAALKFTVAKYYTPSGRCIQGINYKEGGGLKEEDSKYTASKIQKKDRSVYYTKNGRVVRDGGGIEADFKVEAPKASALEVTLLRSGVLSEFAAEWSKTHELTNNFKVDEDTYRSFQSFVAEKQRSGDLQLESLYSRNLADLKKALKQSGYKGSEREVEALQASIVRDIQRDFEKYRQDIKEDIGQNILARYLPESMLLERGIKNDQQISAAAKLLSNPSRFNKLLARDAPSSANTGDTSLQVAATGDENSVRGKIRL